MVQTPPIKKSCFLFSLFFILSLVLLGYGPNLNFLPAHAKEWMIDEKFRIPVKTNPYNLDCFVYVVHVPIVPTRKYEKCKVDADSPFRDGAL